MKQRSPAEPSPSDYLFAVCPVSLQFGRNYKTRFHLYFQKNMQIISKHTTPFPEVKKDEITQFSTLETVNPFRIHSEKGFEYHWSLYIFRTDNEQFIEGQKITLGQIWNEFKSTRNPLFQQSAKFNAIPCKLNFLVVVGSSNHELFDLTQKYFNGSKLHSGITTDQKIDHPLLNGSELCKKKEELKKQEKVECQRVSRVEVAFEDQISQCFETKEVKIQQLEDMRISDIISKGRNSLSSKDNFLLYQNLLSPRDEQNPKLSNSELEIGRQIQEQVISKQSSKESSKARNKEGSQKGQANLLTVSSRKMAESGEKVIRMTSSQILNDKQEVIVPMYQQKKFIAIFICLLTLLIGSGLLALSNSRQSASDKTKNRSKKRKNTNQSKKQVTNKKSKAKR